MWKRSNFTAMLSPILLLRVGVGLTLLYIGVVAVADPETWALYVPLWVPGPAVSCITVCGVLDLVLAALIIAGRALPLASFLAAFHFAALILGYGVDDATFQSFGLMFASLALFVLSLPEE